jgi:PAS domain S-box-containing protein
MEKKLAESEEMFRKMSEQTLIGLAILQNNKFEYVNKTFSDTIAYSIEEILSWKSGEYLNSIHPDDRDRMIEQTPKFFSGEYDQKQNNLFRALKKNGEVIWLVTNAGLISYKGAPALLISQMDVTESKKAEDLLRKSEENYRLISENANDLISVFNDKFEYEYINEQVFMKVLGYSKNDLIGKTTLHIIHPDDLKETILTSSKILRKKEGTHQVRFKHRDGSYKWLEITAKNFVNSKGEKKTINISRDITERKRAEQKLKESEDKYRNLFETSPYAIALMDMTGKILDCNSREEEILGYKKDELIGLDFRDLKNVHQKYLPLVLNGFKTLLKGEVPKPQEIQIYKKNGSLIWVYLQASLVKLENETLIQLLTQDITNIKEADIKLKESEVQFRTIAEQTFLGIAILQDNQIKYANEVLAKILEYSLEELSGMSMDYLGEKVFHPDDLPDQMERVRLRRRYGEDSVTPFSTYRMFTKTGELRWIEDYTKVIMYQGKEALLASVMDITEKKKAEEKLKESEEKYREAYNRAEFYKDLFAHDISNILQNILSAMELNKLLLDNPERLKDMQTNLDVIRDQVNRGAMLVSNVRKLSQLEEYKKSIKPIEIMRKIKNTIIFIKNSYQNRDIDIQVESVNKEVYIQANNLIQDVFENILINAVNHNINPKVKIIVKLSREDLEDIKCYKIEFIDNGLGIEDVRKDAIFERAYNEDKSVSGMGLGLSLVKKIIESFNGKIWVENKVEGDYSKGSNFIILIPSEI